MSPILSEGNWLIDDLSLMAEHTVEERENKAEKRKEELKNENKCWKRVKKLWNFIDCLKQKKEEGDDDDRHKIKHYYVDFRYNTLNKKIEIMRDFEEDKEKEAFDGLTEYTDFKLGHDLFNALDKDEVK